MFIEDRTFQGPYILGKDEIPDVPAIALVCTEAGEGVKVMSVLHSDKIATEIANSPKRDCWKKHTFRLDTQIFIYETDETPEEREAYRLKFLERRAQFMFCDELPVLEDDF